MGMIHEKTCRKSRATVPLKSSESKKHLAVKKYIISSYSVAKNIPEIADLKLRTSEKNAIAELWSCGCEATFL
jgi:hypothetical protein